MVDEYLRPRGPVSSNVFVIGDGASTPYSGMAQTAIHDGRVVARNIGQILDQKSMSMEASKKPYYSVPVGPNWAVTIIGPWKIYGRLGWILRRLADLRYFLSVLPLSQAVGAFRSGQTIPSNTIEFRTHYRNTSISIFFARHSTRQCHPEKPG